MSAEPAELKTGDLMDLLAAKYPRDRYALFFDVPSNRKPRCCTWSNACSSPGKP